MFSRLMALKINKAPIMMAVLAAILALTGVAARPVGVWEIGRAGNPGAGGANSQQVIEPQAANPVYLPIIYFTLPCPPSRNPSPSLTGMSAKSYPPSHRTARPMLPGPSLM